MSSLCWWTVLWRDSESGLPLWLYQKEQLGGVFILARTFGKFLCPLPCYGRWPKDSREVVRIQKRRFALLWRHSCRRDLPWHRKHWPGINLPAQIKKIIEREKGGFVNSSKLISKVRREMCFAHHWVILLAMSTVWALYVELHYVMYKKWIR